MNIFVGNSSKFFFPIFTLNSAYFFDYFALIFIFIHIMLTILCVLLTIQVCIIVKSVRVFHSNMTTIILVILGQWFEILIAKIILFPYQMGFLTVGEAKVFQLWIANDPKEMPQVEKSEELTPLFISGILFLHYAFTLTFSVFILTCERACATFFIKDYEKKPRAYICITLLFLTHLTCFSLSCLATCEIMNFTTGVAISGFFIIGAVLIYFIILHINIGIQKRLADHDKQQNYYSLAIRFQAKENARSLELAKKVVLFASFAILCGMALLIVTALHLSTITQDGIKAITEQLSPTARLNLAALDPKFFHVATKWHDIKTLVFDEDVSQWQTHFKTDARETAVMLCPALKKLIIQVKLTDFDAVMLNKLNLKLTKLYISTENLSLINFPKFEKLRTLHLVSDSTKEMKVVEVVEPRVLTAAFPQTLTRICLTGIYLTENLVNFMANLKNLKCLDMIGCLVDTRVGAKYVPVLETYPSLDELSIPPSLFSFSVKSKTPADLTLKNLKVTKIGIYMDQFDDDTFYSQSCRFLPKNLKYLVVFGNYLPLKRYKHLKSLKNFMIIFGPNTSLASCPQANLTNVRLLSHLVRGPPYIPQEYNPNFLRNHDTILGSLQWQFSLIEWKDNNVCRKEVLALRKRMNVAENEDAVFEGLRIPAPMIQERFGALRERRMMPGSPNDFQVFQDDIPQAPPLPVRRLAPAPQATPPPTTRRRSRRMRHGSQQPRRISAPRRRRPQSAPPAPLPIEDVLGRRPQSDSMRTHPPSPPVGTQTGAVFNATLPNLSPIGNNNTSTASRIGGTVTPATAPNGTSVLNRGFVATPQTSTVSNMGSSESRRLSTVSTTSEMSTATASPERLQNPAPTAPPAPSAAAPRAQNPPARNQQSHSREDDDTQDINNPP
ncbi:Protein CBR-SRE-39 [Caenorhabditis briggsae]|uniref:Protein CBR-SRE-39 n=1 Tax=Caenorhabditis briggsae TaxID=6238 RepID=A8XHU1_CAEBR|nr:Protein CBR-SRE-39 [Caenorhabditis briggsae]CAP32207.2 Protein CBR-SRE-39 [Caenorhabditis briggsae]